MKKVLLAAVTVLLSLTAGFCSPVLATDVKMVGNIGYDIDGDYVKLWVDKIVNNGSARSNTLKLKLWATTAKYSGGEISGYVLGEYTFDGVLDGGAYRSIITTVSYYPPPDGDYYITMILTEWNYASDYMVDYHTFDGTVSFGGGGGGGCFVNTVF